MKAAVRSIPLGVGRQSIVVVFVISALWYLSWRTQTFNQEAPIFSWLVFAAECFAFVVALFHIFISWRISVRESPPPPPGLSVAVFVPTINEPITLVRRTLLAVVHMRYPHETWLLDDGNRPEMAALARELGCRYLSRETNTDAKAGNLNHGLAHTEADYIALFDADHCPHKDFLVKTLGYFNNPLVAFVQTPQDFYNLDSYQHWLNPKRHTTWNEQTLFFRLIQRGKDVWNAAIFCGSCAIIRRDRLDEINGFATGTVTEDIHTSLRFHKMGYESVFHAEPLAFGLAPSNNKSFIIQRVRWGQGAMQVWRQESILFCRDLTLAQRVSYLASITVFFEGWQRGFFYFLPPLVVATGWMPVNTVGPEFIQHFIPYFLFSIWAYVEVSRGYGWPILSEQYTMARFGAFIWSTFGYFKRNLKFKVTPKALRDLSEGWLYVVPQISILVLNIVTVMSILLFLSTALPSALPVSVLIASLFWAAFNIIIAGAAIRLFTRRRIQHRGEYRSPIPLPARLMLGEQEIYGSVDSLSTRGFRLVAELPAAIKSDKTIRGEIYLPDGPITFKARLVRLAEECQTSAGFDNDSDNTPQAYYAGCEFILMSTHDQDRLSCFLYGTDLQITINGLRERKLTPIEWLQRYIRRHQRRKEHMAAQWVPMSYTIDCRDGAERIGLISSDRRMALMSNRSLMIKTPIELQVLSSTSKAQLYGKLSNERRVESPGSPLYLYNVDRITEV